MIIATFHINFFIHNDGFESLAYFTVTEHSAADRHGKRLLTFKQL